MSPRLSLSQAQAVLARLPPDVRVDWGKPAETARDILTSWRAGFIRCDRATLYAVLSALDAYARHIEFQAGCQFAETAIRTAMNAAITSEPTMAGGNALRNFEAHIADGLHLAGPEPTEEKPAPQWRDVWRLSEDPTTDAEIRCVHEETGQLTVSALHGNRAHKVVSIADFVRNRRLVFRDGKAVG